MQTKEILRANILRKLEEQPEAARKEKSQAIKDKVFSSQDFKKAKSIMCYISLDTEVDTGEIIRGAKNLGKKIFAPVIEGDMLGIAALDGKLKKGPLGVLQPEKQDLKSFSPDKLDMALIPGLAFTKAGARLGRGKAYFDRFLKELPDAVKTAGLAFDFQVLPSIPQDSHDIPVNEVISN